MLSGLGSRVSQAFPYILGGAALGGIPAAILGYASADKDKMLTAADYALSGAGIGGLLGGGVGMAAPIKQVIRDIEEEKAREFVKKKLQPISGWLD